MFGILVEALRVRLQQGGHLVDKRTGAPGAYPVHPLVYASGKIDDFGIFAAQFYGYVGLGGFGLERRGHGYHFLGERDGQMAGEGQAAGTGYAGEGCGFPQLLAGPGK